MLTRDFMADRSVVRGLELAVIKKSHHIVGAGKREVASTGKYLMMKDKN